MNEEKHHSWSMINGKYLLILGNSLYIFGSLLFSLQFFLSLKYEVDPFYSTDF